MDSKMFFCARSSVSLSASAAVFWLQLAKSPTLISCNQESLGFDSRNTRKRSLRRKGHSRSFWILPGSIKNANSVLLTIVVTPLEVLRFEVSVFEHGKELL